jgi:hypothetical protein
MADRHQRGGVDVSRDAEKRLDLGLVRHAQRREHRSND